MNEAYVSATLNLSNPIPTDFKFLNGRADPKILGSNSRGFTKVKRYPVTTSALSPCALFVGSEIAAYSSSFFSNVERIALVLEDMSEISMSEIEELSAKPTLDISQPLVSSCTKWASNTISGLC